MPEIPTKAFDIPETQVDTIMFYLDNGKLKLQWT